MTEANSLLSNTANSGARAFSKLPVIRKFESLLTDEEFQSAGLKVVAHPRNEASVIVQGDDFFADDVESVSNKRFGSNRAFLQVFHIQPANDCPRETVSQEVQPIADRLKELRELSKDEELPFAESSAAQASKWLSTSGVPRIPSVFLLNNGNIRLLWKSGGAQLGIQFLGDGRVQFVWLGEDEETDRLFGTLKTSDLMNRISGLDLLGVLGF